MLNPLSGASNSLIQKKSGMRTAPLGKCNSVPEKFIPPYVKVMLILGTALIVLWEAALAVFANHAWLWILSANGLALILASYLVLLHHEKR